MLDLLDSKQASDSRWEIDSCSFSYFYNFSEGLKIVKNHFWKTIYLIGTYQLV